jgi:hypothetical protein
MNRRRQGRRWEIAGLAAALLAPSIAPRPAAAGPFDYIGKADQQAQQHQEQERRAAEERQQRDQHERQRQDQERAREQQDRQQQERQQRDQQERAHDQQERARAEQERRVSEERQRQEQERRGAEERQRRIERERQAEQQRHEVERRQQAEREHQERVRSEAETREQQRQRAEQERAVREQQAREARRANEEQSARAAQAREARERQLREAQAQQEQARAQEEQGQREQARRAQEEQFQREQAQRAREEQLRHQERPRSGTNGQTRPVPWPAQRVAAGPFGYIRQADQYQGRSALSSSRPAPAQREQPRSSSNDRGSGTRSSPFDYTRSPREFPSRAPSSSGSTFRAPSGAPVRESPFGSVRGGNTSGRSSPPTHTESPRPSGSFPGTLSRPSVGSPGYPSTPGSRGFESGAPVPPLPRGGRGTLGRYFSRDARPHRERSRGYYPPYYGSPYYGDSYGRYGTYPPGYYSPCPYDVYPPAIFYPPSSPPVVIVPAPDILVVPDQDYDRSERYSRREASDGTSLNRLLDDIEAAWEMGNISLLMTHVRTDGDLEIYRDGEWIDSLSRSEFGRKSTEAFREYDTLSMTFEKPDLISDDEARARAEHVFRTRNGREQRVHVTYAFRRYGRRWRIVGLDYERPRAEAADAAPSPGAPRSPDISVPAVPPTAIAPSTAPAEEPGPTAAPAALGSVQLVSAPPLRLRDLLNASRPRRLASLKWLHGGRRTLYTLQGMRGVAPRTMAWALYRRGEKRPVETGVAEVGALPASGWVAVRAAGPRLMTLAASSASAPATPRTRAPTAVSLQTRTFNETTLSLTATRPPVKTARSSVAHRRRHR